MSGLIVAFAAWTLGVEAYPRFTCAYEKDHNPPLDAEGERWFQRAYPLEKQEETRNTRTCPHKNLGAPIEP
ncbi:hypothetical protein ACRS5L_05065 [Metapseudomonas otitidis]|uniref:hypothetical protein n=1 Tax=Metapseudomonas otitidis TaxID=319939 RepID=UPI003EE3F08B